MVLMTQAQTVPDAADFARAAEAADLEHGTNKKKCFLKLMLT